MENINTLSGVSLLRAPPQILTRLPSPSAPFIKRWGRKTTTIVTSSPPRRDAETWNPAAVRLGTTVSVTWGSDSTCGWSEIQVWDPSAPRRSKPRELSTWTVAQTLKMPLMVMVLLLTLVSQCWGTPQVGFSLIISVQMTISCWHNLTFSPHSGGTGALRPSCTWREHVRLHEGDIRFVNFNFKELKMCCLFCAEGHRVLLQRPSRDKDSTSHLGESRHDTSEILMIND